MRKEVNFLTPINIDIPPAHTQVWPRCATCKKFPVCNIRLDYLKTLYLIQEILGDPQEDYELHKSNPYAKYPCYEGNPIENPETIFPAELTFTERILPTGETLTESVTGQLESAKYQNYNTVLFMYDSEGYKVVFRALYNEETKEFDIKDGYDIVYHIKYIFPTESILELQVNLETWRNEMIEKEDKDADIINTTYFSAQLNCRFYEQIKGLRPEEGFRRMIAEFPNGIPDGEGNYYHIETLHIEPNKVPCYNPNAGKVAFAPIPYPVFVPRPCKKKFHYYGDKNE